MQREVTLTIGLAALAGTASMAVARRLSVPAILLLLGTGALLGGSGLHVVQPKLLGTGLNAFVELAVAIILFEGALSLQPAQFTRNAGPIRNLLTIGALATLVGATLVVHHALGSSWAHSLLAGSILVVTGPTVVTPLLRHIRPKPELAEILRWEAILIDPIGALVAVCVLEAVLVGGGEAFYAAAAAYGKSLFAGTVIGVTAGLVLERALVRGLVDEELVSPLALAFACGSFALAELAADNSGLFAVTSAGLMLAIRRPPGLDEIEQFKGRVTAFMLAILFVLLAGLMDLNAVASVGRNGFFLLGGLFLVRLVAVTLSTLGSGLGFRDRIFLAWVSPRGVVAAAAASIFSQRLAEHGDASADEVRTAIFCVIIGTVVVQGLTARTIARWLGVAAPDPNEVVIVGAGPFSRALALELAGAGTLVTVVDKNAQKLKGLVRPGLATIPGDAQSRGVVSRISAGNTAFVIAGTPNDEANAVVCAAFAAVGARVTQIPSGLTAANLGVESAATGYPFTFGSDLTLGELERALLRGSRLRTVKLDRPENREEMEHRVGHGFLSLVAVGERGSAKLVQEPQARFEPGTAIVGIELSPEVASAPVPLVPVEKTRWLPELARVLVLAILALAPVALAIVGPASAEEHARWLRDSDVTGPYFTGDARCGFRPLAAALSSVEWGLFALDPLGHRAVSAALWLLVVLAAHALLRRLDLERWTAFAGAAIFAVSAPHATEVLAPASQSELLSGFFLLLALAAHAQGRGAVAALALAASLAASTAGALFLPLAWVLDRLRASKEPRSSVPLLGYAAVTAAVAAARYYLLGADAATSFHPGPFGDAGPVPRLIAFSRGAAVSVAKLVYPVDVGWPDPLVLTARPTEIDIAIVALGVLLGPVSWGHRGFARGGAIFIATLLPAVHLLGVDLGDGHLLLPALGVSIAVATALEDLKVPALRALAAAGLVLVHLLVLLLPHAVEWLPAL